MSDVGQKMPGLTPDGGPIGHRVYVDGCFDIPDYRAKSLVSTSQFVSRMNELNQKMQGSAPDGGLSDYRAKSFVSTSQLVSRMNELSQNMPGSAPDGGLSDYQTKSFVSTSQLVSRMSDVGQKMQGSAPDGRPMGHRVYVDGCYTQWPSNVLHQAEKFEKTLAVGDRSDAEILQHKEPSLSLDNNHSLQSKLSLFLGVKIHTVLQFAKEKKPEPTDKE